MIARRRELLTGVYDRLLQVFGPQYWWPAQTRFEVVVGAILTQNTSWANVTSAIAQLRAHGLLDLGALHRMAEHELAALIRSSGTYNQKARKLKAFCTHVACHWEGDMDRFLAQEIESLRQELLTIHGIGLETADSIVLYASDQPSFVVDTYTHRIFSRHGWVAEEIDYEDLRDFFMAGLAPDVALYKEFHALLVRTGHLYCRRKPACAHCPLKGWAEED